MLTRTVLRSLFGSLLLAGLAPASAVPALPVQGPVELLVDDGSGVIAAAHSIVVSFDPRAPATEDEEMVDAAAAALAQKLLTMTGVAFDVIEWDGSTIAGIMLGRASDFGLGAAFPAADASERHAYLLHTHADGLLLLGASAQAADFAVRHVVAHAGYRRYFPTLTWEVVPNYTTPAESRIDLSIRRDVAFPDVNFTPVVNNANGGATLITEWAQWNMTKHSRQSCSHVTTVFTSTDPYVAEDGTATTYAEWFTAHPDAVTTDSATFAAKKLCTQYPGVDHLMHSWASDRLRAVPNILTTSITPTDGGRWDGCPATDEDVEGDPGYLHPTERAVSLANAVMQRFDDDGALDPGGEFEGRGLCLLSYSSHSLPPDPAQIAVDGRIFLTLTQGYQRGNLSFDEAHAAWTAAGASVRGVYPYWTGYLDETTPGVSKVARIAEVKTDLQHMSGDLGLTLLNVDSVGQFGPVGLQLWMAAQLARNPNRDLNALREDFYAKAFGVTVDLDDPNYDPDTAPAIVRYFDRLDGEPRPPLLTLDLVAGLYELLETAHGEATDSAAQSRVEDLALYVRFLDLYWRYTAAQRREYDPLVQNSAETDAECETRVAAADPTTYALGAKEQALDALLAHVYRIRYRHLIYPKVFFDASVSKPCERDGLSKHYEHLLGAGVTLDFSNAGNVYTEAPLDPGDAPYSTADVQAWFAAASDPVLYPRKLFLDVSFPPSLEPPDAALALPDERGPTENHPYQTLGNFGYIDAGGPADEAFYVWVDAPEDGFEIEVMAPRLGGQRSWPAADWGTVTLTLSEAGGGYTCEQSLSPQILEISLDQWLPVRFDAGACPSLMGAPGGLHVLRLTGARLGYDLRWNVNSYDDPIRIVRALAPDDPPHFGGGGHTLYFYVPPGTEIVGGYAEGAAGFIEYWDPSANGGTGVWKSRSFDEDMLEAIEGGVAVSRSNGRAYFAIPTVVYTGTDVIDPHLDPSFAGPDDAIWRIRACTGTCMLLTVPPYAAVKPEEILVPVP